MQNISSEQELKQLLNEGKISQTEYEQLREAMESKQCSDIQVNRPKHSRKQAMIAAVLFTIVTALLLWICLMCIDKPALRNKSIVIGVGVVCVIGSSIQALRYWLTCWTHKDTSL
ncbi:MAG: hypothetical protein ACYTEN_07000 [Planctomycetota bacterium]|jgi:preprotein translocase subunit SecF